MNRKLNIGIAGVAHPKAGVYAAALREIEGAALVGIWDDLERGRRFADEYGLVHHADLGELVKQSDALIVASETVHRPAIVATAAQASLPVLCMPPLAATLSHARAIIEACQRSGTELAIAAPLRYHQSIQQLREAVQTGVLGELLFVRAAGQAKHPTDAWRIDPALAGGGALFDRAALLVDLLRWIVSRDVREVYAEVATLAPGGLAEDTALLMLTFECGLSASLDPSWSRPAAYTGQDDLIIEVTGTNGVAHLDAFAQYVEVFGNDSRHGQRYPSGDDLDRLMLADWLRAVHTGASAPIGAAESLRALEIVLAAYGSAELRAPVFVDR